MQTIPLVFEDDEILLVHKAAGIAVQGGKGIAHPLDETLSAQMGYKVHLVHRLDRETSGLLLVAKNPPAAKKWISLIASREVTKEYTAICFGEPILHGKKTHTGTIDSVVSKNGRPLRAVTHFSVEDVRSLALSGNDGTPDLLVVSRVHLTLGTGRMHQIRIHLAACAAPIVADDKHGNFRLNKWAKKVCGIKTLCLAATKLSLPLADGRRTFEIAPPPHFATIFSLQDVL